MEELVSYNLYDKVDQALAALLPCQAVGVQGDKRYIQWHSLIEDSANGSRVVGQIIALRAITTSDFMTATRCQFDIENRGFLDHVATRIINQIPGIVRVMYDGEYTIRQQRTNHSLTVLSNLEATVRALCIT